MTVREWQSVCVQTSKIIIFPRISPIRQYPLWTEGSGDDRRKVREREQEGRGVEIGIFFVTLSVFPLRSSLRWYHLLVRPSDRLNCKRPVRGTQNLFKKLINGGGGRGDFSGNKSIRRLILNRPVGALETSLRVFFPWVQTKFPGVSKRLLSLSVILFFSQAEKQKRIIIGKLHATTCIITELDYLQRRSTVCESAWELAFSFAFWVNPVTGSCLTQHKIDYRVIRY